MRQHFHFPIFPDRICVISWCLRLISVLLRSTFFYFPFSHVSLCGTTLVWHLSSLISFQVFLRYIVHTATAINCHTDIWITGILQEAASWSRQILTITQIIIGHSLLVKPTEQTLAIGLLRITNDGRCLRRGELDDQITSLYRLLAVTRAPSGRARDNKKSWLPPFPSSQTQRQRRQHWSNKQCLCFFLHLLSLQSKLSQVGQTIGRLQWSSLLARVRRWSPRQEERAGRVPGRAPRRTLSRFGLAAALLLPSPPAAASVVPLALCNSRPLLLLLLLLLLLSPVLCPSIAAHHWGSSLTPASAVSELSLPSSQVSWSTSRSGTVTLSLPLLSMLLSQTSWWSNIHSSANLPSNFLQYCPFL